MRTSLRGRRHKASQVPGASLSACCGLGPRLACLCWPWRTNTCCLPHTTSRSAHATYTLSGQSPSPFGCGPQTPFLQRRLNFSTWLPAQDYPGRDFHPLEASRLPGVPSLSVTNLPLTYYHAISLPLILALFKRFLRGSYAPEETPEICLPEPGLRPARREEHRRWWQGS